MDQWEGAHIIPHSAPIWRASAWDQTKMQNDFAPLGIDDIRNGLLLKDDIHKAFDKQYWSVVEVGDQLKIVKLHKLCPHGIADTFLQLPDDNRTDDGNDFSITDFFIWVGVEVPPFADKTLLRFHLETGVFRWMTGAGAKEEYFGDDDDMGAIKVLSGDFSFDNYITTSAKATYF